VDPVTREFNYAKLHEITKVVTRNLNKASSRLHRSRCAALCCCALRPTEREAELCGRHPLVGASPVVRPPPPLPIATTTSPPQVIDVNFYPVPEARNSNMRHRPIGLGVQGMADAFALMRLPFDSEAAAEVNRAIFETIYHA
jgi:hypothetical protein